MCKKKRAFAIMVLGLMMLFILTGCTKSENSGEILIGVVWPFASDNNLFEEGIDLAVSQINERGGISGKTLKLIKEDDDSEVVKGISIAQSFSDNDSVLAVIGHRNSYVSVPASAIYDRAGIVMLSPSSTATELTQRGYSTTFRCIPGNSEISYQIAKYMAGLKLKRLVIYYSGDAYGKDMASTFEDNARRLGITVVDRFDFYSDLNHLKRLQSRWQAFGFDGIFIASSSAKEGAQFISDVRQIGIQVPIAAGDALDAPELALIGGDAAEGTVVGTVFHPDNKSKETKHFVKTFQEAYQAMPTSDAALGYDAVLLLAAAMEKTGAPERASIADGLLNIGKWAGACGTHEFVATGDDLGDLVVLKQLTNGGFVYLQD